MNEVVQNFYDEKTEGIVARYGPGPRVHYHLGYFSEPEVTARASLQGMRAVMNRAQEELLHVAGETWSAGGALAGSVLDVGCGVGGGSIFWAQQFASRVTALTVSAAQIPYIRRFSEQAGVSSLVTPVLGRAEDFVTAEPFDAAVAVESMCHMNRPQVFAMLGRAIRPGGVLCIEDVFLRDESWRVPFDRYWRTNIGTLDDYVRDADSAGFVLDRQADVTHATTEFWMQSMALLEGEIQEMERLGTPPARHLSSIRWHARFLRAWRERGIEARVLRFVRTG
ncbi:SAM-dependent methyltransferase [Streptomyces chryseus]